MKYFQKESRKRLKKAHELSVNQDKSEFTSHSGQTSKTKPFKCEGCLYEDFSIGRLLGHLQKNPGCKAKYSPGAIEDLEKNKTTKRQLTKSTYYRKMKKQRTFMVIFLFNSIYDKLKRFST